LRCSHERSHPSLQRIYQRLPIEQHPPWRPQLGLRAGTRLVWHVMRDGLVVIRAKTRSLRDMAGMLNPLKPT